MAQATPDHSPEYLSFHENFEALVSTFKAQAAAYADSLFSNGYIPDEFLEFSRLHGVMDSDKSRKILDTIFHRIKVNPSVFHDFIAAIAGPSTDDVGKKLHDSYERHKTATSRVEQPHPPPHQQPPKASLPQTGLYNSVAYPARGYSLTLITVLLDSRELSRSFYYCNQGVSSVMHSEYGHGFLHVDRPNIYRAT